MNIPENEWYEACGKLVQDDNGRLWSIVGFINEPTVILTPIKLQGHPMQTADTRERVYAVMGSENSKQYHRLVRADGSVA